MKLYVELDTIKQAIPLSGSYPLASAEYTALTSAQMSLGRAPVAPCYNDKQLLYYPPLNSSPLFITAQLNPIPNEVQSRLLLVCKAM